MLAYIKGTLEMKMTGYIVIDVGGLGYKVFMSEVGSEKIGNIGEEVKVHTYYKVREDDISIYGFNTLEELKMFELLISVSGVGAKTALTMLAVCEPSEFALAVISEDVKALTRNSRNWGKISTKNHFGIKRQNNKRAGNRENKCTSK